MVDREPTGEIEPPPKPKVGIVIDPALDIEVLSGAETTLKEFGISYSVDMISPFFNTGEMVNYAKTARERGLKAIIVCTDGVSHLAGMIKAFTIAPVIGVPISGGELNGIDTLVSMVQMPNGTPVNVMGMNRTVNAALSAIEMIANEDESIALKLLDYRQKMTDTVLRDNHLP